MRKSGEKRWRNYEGTRERTMLESTVTSGK